MSELTMIANIHAGPDRTALVKEELLRLLPPTRAEAGCIAYDLHQDDEDPAHFVMFEKWASREAWQAHAKSSHMAAFMAATEGAVAGFAVDNLTRIG